VCSIVNYNKLSWNTIIGCNSGYNTLRRSVASYSRSNCNTLSYNRLNYDTTVDNTLGDSTLRCSVASYSRSNYSTTIGSGSNWNTIIASNSSYSRSNRNPTVSSNSGYFTSRRSIAVIDESRFLQPIPNSECGKLGALTRGPGNGNPYITKLGLIVGESAQNWGRAGTGKGHPIHGQGCPEKGSCVTGSRVAACTMTHARRDT